MGRYDTLLEEPKQTGEQGKQTPSAPQQKKEPKQQNIAVSPAPSQPVAVQPQRQKNVIPQASNTESNITLNITSNITILQTDIERLREPGYKPQTFRVGDEELDKLKDLSYVLSKTLRKKVTQGDLLRVAILLLDKNMTTNEADLFALLKAII